MRKFFGCQCQKMVKRNAVNRFHTVLKGYRVFYLFVSYYIVNCKKAECEQQSISCIDNSLTICFKATD